MSAVNPYKYKKPSQIRGERFLRNNNLLVPPEALSNIEVIKRKARAIRLKEEYQRKYLTNLQALVECHRTLPLHAHCP